MITPRQLLSTFLSIATLCGSAAAQVAAGSVKPPADAPSTGDKSSPARATAPSVTASASESGARFAAPGAVLQMRLQIYAAAGELVFDSGARAGGVIDWKIADIQQGLADGAYLCVVTVKDLNNRATQKLSAMSVASGRISLSVAREDELTAAQLKAVASARQALKVDASEVAGAATVMREGKERAVTVTSHDGQVGAVTSTTGGLSFRTGDFFAGTETERMRLTPDGRVGIGTSDPQATLDVAGAIRARGGIVFDDGTVLKSAQGASRLAAAAIIGGGTVTPAATGAGTANQLAKWTDNVGTLGNSLVSESNGNVGVGISNPTQRLHVVSSFSGINPLSGDRIGAFVNDGDPANHAIFAVIAGANGVAGIDLGDTQNQNQSYVRYNNGALGEKLRFGINNTDLLTIQSNGNVGIGTPNAAQRLEVAGNIKLSGTGSTLIFSDGTSMTTAAGGGSTPSGTSIVTAINDPATAGAIGDNRLSSNLARLNGANAWSGANVFGVGLSANGALVTNVGNPVNAGDAVNKAYTDANFVRFVPNAEQLSVGDANGTATMINLRGGSTCCSGPGGHTPAWFKVFQNGSFVATGNLGIGVSPMEGKGYRTSWYTYKGAFRSGYADNEWDDANTGFFSWAGGSNSTASGLYSFAFGDTNYASSTSSIAFGSGNEVKGAAGFSAGAGNRVCNTYGVAFGNKAQSGGPLVNGRCDPDSFNITGLAAIALGYNVTADKDHTTAMGKFASNNGFSGTFVWSDGSATAAADTFKNTANNEFAARATGGFRFRTNLTGTTGCNLPAGSGVFNCTSSRTTKENFLNVKGEDVLARVRNLSVSTWNYIDEGRQVRHMGPMAEDFYKSFGLGTNNISIGVQDLAGVSLAAVKALDARTANLQQSNAQLAVTLQQKTAEVAQLRAELDGMEQRLAALEQGAPTRRSGRTRPARR